MLLPSLQTIRLSSEGSGIDAKVPGQDGAFKLRVKKLAALAFVPVSDLVATFESLSTSFLNDELRLLAYFEKTWIGQPVGGRRLPPLFPITCRTSVTDQALGPHVQ